MQTGVIPGYSIQEEIHGQNDLFSTFVTYYGRQWSG